jgi:hypothetical protein
MEMMEQKTPRPARKRRTKFHNAAVDTLRYMFYYPEKNGDIELTDEYQLSANPLRIDAVIKKLRDGDAETAARADAESDIGRIFRKHNLLEYKSPAEPQISYETFEKLVRGYVGIYAAQEGVKITDMSATIICYKKPAELLETLEKDFYHEVLQKYDGIYYITYKGIPAENSLAVQIVVVPELPPGDGAAMLKALEPECDKETAIKVLDAFHNGNERLKTLGYYKDVFYKINIETIIEEAKKMNSVEKAVRKLAKEGCLANYERELELRGRLEGVHEILQFLKSGHSLEEAETQFSLQYQ